MGTASRFSSVLHSELSIHAAWLPVTNTFKLGDYGLISDGVLVKMGSIVEFGVSFQDAQGATAKLDFSSQGTRVVKMAGDVAVDALPNADIDATLKIEFERANSFLLRAMLQARQIQNINQVAKALATARQRGWQRRFRVVSGIYTGTDCVILSTREANSVVEIGGKAKDLSQIGLGSAGAEFSFKSSKELGLEIVGQTGVVGLEMFKLGFWGGVNVLDAAAERGSLPDVIPIETTRGSQHDLEDDL